MGRPTKTCSVQRQRSRSSHTAQHSHYLPSLSPQIHRLISYAKPSPVSRARNQQRYLIPISWTPLLAGYQLMSPVIVTRTLLQPPSSPMHWRPHSVLRPHSSFRSSLHAHLSFVHFSIGVSPSFPTASFYRSCPPIVKGERSLDFLDDPSPLHSVSCQFTLRSKYIQFLS